MSTTRKLVTAAIAAVSLLAACGGDDGASAGGDQTKAADALLESAEEADIALDADCVREASAKLTDADAKLIVDSIDTDGEPTLSDAGEALKGEIFACLDPSQLVDQMMEEIGDQPGMDKDCVREVLDGLTSDEIASIAQGDGDLSGEVMSQVMQDIVPCMSAG
jgi:hypothetical protein